MQHAAGVQASSRVSRVYAGLLAALAATAFALGLGWVRLAMIAGGSTVLRTLGCLLHNSEGPPSSATISGSVSFSGTSAIQVPARWRARALFGRGKNEPSRSGPILSLEANKQTLPWWQQLLRAVSRGPSSWVAIFFVWNNAPRRDGRRWALL